jgi:hypothetical protein
MCHELHLYCVVVFHLIHTNTVDLTKATTDLLASLDAFSGGKLTRRDDLGALLELVALHEQRDVLDELSFLAKFISKTHGIMIRIGIQGEGYDKLSREFTAAITKTTSLLDSILVNAHAGDRQYFASSYMALTPASLQELLALCYDLSWYKNWMIDHPQSE